METITRKDLATYCKGLREHGFTWSQIKKKANEAYKLSDGGSMGEAALCASMLRFYPASRTKAEYKKHKKAKAPKQPTMQPTLELRLAEQIMTAPNLTDQERVHMMKRIFT